MGRSIIYLFFFCIFSEFGLGYIQENGLEYPIVFVDKTGLGLRYCIKLKSIYTLIEKLYWDRSDLFCLKVFILCKMDCHYL